MLIDSEYSTIKVEKKNGDFHSSYTVYHMTWISLPVNQSTNQQPTALIQVMIKLEYSLKKAYPTINFIKHLDMTVYSHALKSTTSGFCRAVLSVWIGYRKDFNCAMETFKYTVECSLWLIISCHPSHLSGKHTMVAENTKKMCGFTTQSGWRSRHKV